MKLRSYNNLKEVREKNMAAQTGGAGFGKKSKLIEDARDNATLESGKVYFGKTEDGKTIEIYEDEGGIQKEDTNPPTGYPDRREPIYAKINPGVKKERIRYGIAGDGKASQKLKEDIIENSNNVVWPKPKKERIKEIESEYKFVDAKPNKNPDVWKTTTSISSTKVNPPQPMVDKVPPLYGGGGAPEKYEIPRGDDLSEVLSKLDDLNRKVDYLIKNSN